MIKECLVALCQYYGGIKNSDFAMQVFLKEEYIINKIDREHSIDFVKQYYNYTMQGDFYYIDRCVRITLHK